MKMCQYEFSFQNDYFGEIKKNIGEVTGITEKDTEDIFRCESEKEMIYGIRGRNGSFIIFACNKASYVYLMIVRCDEKYAEQVEKILYSLNDEIEDDYDEDHSQEIRNVINCSETFFQRIDNDYNISDKLN